MKIDLRKEAAKKRALRKFVKDPDFFKVAVAHLSCLDRDMDYELSKRGMAIKKDDSEKLEEINACLRSKASSFL